MEIATIIDGSIGEKLTSEAPDNHVKEPGATYEQVVKALEWAGYEVERKEEEGNYFSHQPAEETYRGIEVKDPMTDETLAEYGLTFKADTEEEMEIEGLIAAGHAIGESAPYERRGTAALDPKHVP
jgi:hypothetical protein